ncbi:uncharacterized protein METZ01_LOCUS287244, partial [marine metagenome]
MNEEYSQNIEGFKPAISLLEERWNTFKRN